MPVRSCSTDDSCITDDRAVTERGDHPGVSLKTMSIKHQEHHIAGRDLAEEAVTPLCTDIIEFESHATIRHADVPDTRATT
jgi:hypothetical protein